MAHSLAHHAMSGLCYVDLHLAAHCRKYRRRQATIDLLQPDRSVIPGLWPKPLRLSIAALSKTFGDLLEKEHIDIGHISGATALFEFRPDQSPIGCLARLDLADGKQISVAVGFDGRKAEVVPHDT